MIPSGVMRVSIKGGLRTSEIFDYSIWFAASVIAQQDVDAVANQAASVVVDTAYNEMVGLLDTNSTYTGVSVYGYPTGGPSATFIGEHSAVAVGTGTNPLPNQVSAVVSTRTATSGRSYRGRLYLPATGQDVGSDGQWPVTMVSAVLSGMKALINGIAATTLPSGGSPTPVVVSQKLGVATTMTSLDMNSVPDIQRRRVNKTLPSHQAGVTL